MSSQNIKLTLHCRTWQRDSHGLFDYEAKQYERYQNKIDQSVKIIQQDAQVVTAPLEAVVDNCLTLAYLARDENGYTLSRGPTNKPMECEKIWAVIKEFDKDTGYRLSEGDRIRLGRIYMRVMEMHGFEGSGIAYNQNQPVLSYRLSKGGLNPNLKQRDSEKIVLGSLSNIEAGVACRICLSDISELDNPLISPCHCSGTMGNIHIKCLQEWFRNKTVTRDRDSCITYSLQKLECEICKMHYPPYLDLNNQILRLFEIPRPPGKYIMLEEVIKDRHSISTVHMIPLEEKKQIRIGRGNESDVRISDISVSRNHAMIKVANNGLYLFDNGSKFGTLVQVKRPIQLERGKCVIQSGRSTIELHVENTWNWCSCFSLCSKGLNREDPREMTEEYQQLYNLLQSF